MAGWKLTPVQAIRSKRRNLPKATVWLTLLQLSSLPLRINLIHHKFSWSKGYSKC